MQKVTCFKIDSKFKSRVALEALRGDLTVAEIAGKYQIHPNKDEIMDIFYDTPFYGVPRLTAELKRRGFNINHKRNSPFAKKRWDFGRYILVRISILPNPIRNTRSFRTS